MGKQFGRNAALTALFLILQPFSGLTATHTITVAEIRPARAGGASRNGQLSFLIADGGAGYTSPPAVALVPRMGGSGGEVNAVV